MRRPGIGSCWMVAAAMVWGSSAWGQGAGRAGAKVSAAAAALDDQQGRLSGAYRELLSQMSGNAGAVAELERGERAWIATRDKTCGKELGCQTRVTGERAEALGEEVKKNARAAGHGLGAGKAATIPAIPMELWGSWVIQEVLPAETISCWDDRQARALVGTQISYHPDWFGWKKVRTENLGSTTSMVTAKQFAEENSGGGANSSQVSFKQLGIGAAAVRQITIRHGEVKLPEASMEMPGETVLVLGRGTLILSVCNVYFKAARLTD